MPPLENTIRRAAPVSALCRQLIVLIDLWKYTGYDRAQRPDHLFFRLAIWDAARVAYEEGWGWQPGPGEGIWSEETIADAARCGVDVFA